MPAPDDLFLARLELDTYALHPMGEVITAGADLVTLNAVDGVLVISVRGTDNPAGWVSDFKAAGVRSRTHPALGICEEGMLEGAEALWPLLVPLMGAGRDIVLQGHSRGAGMVPILAGFALLSGWKPVRVVQWESPWCVGVTCKTLLLSAPIDGVTYWHGDDPVPCIPAVPWLVPNVWPIAHFGEWQLNAFDCHAMAGIVADLEAGFSKEF